MNVKKIIKEFLISRSINGGGVYNDSSTIDSLLQPIEYVELLIHCEKEFGIDIPDEDSEQFKYFCDLVKCIIDMVD